jgi:hypothetical protein
MALSEREKTLLRDFHIVDLKPGEAQPKMTWRDKLRFRRYLLALLKAAPYRSGT